MELPVAFAVSVGVFARPSAVLMASYTLGTSLIEHRYWKTASPDRLANMENFYKNLGIVGGFCCSMLMVQGNTQSMRCAVSVPHESVCIVHPHLKETLWKSQYGYSRLSRRGILALT
jgi:hypothetical protein